MPPTAFREVPGVTWSARAKALLPGRTGSKSGEKGRRRTKGGGTGAPPRPNHSWWGLSKETPWQNYTLGAPPSDGSIPSSCMLSSSESELRPARNTAA